MSELARDHHRLSLRARLMSARGEPANDTGTFSAAIQWIRVC